MELGDIQAFVLKTLREDAAIRAEVAIATAILIALWSAHMKKKRLREAIKIEVITTSSAHKNSYTPAIRGELEKMIAADPSYKVTIFTSRGHVIIGNLTDDIAYMDPRMARRILIFEDRVRVIDDAIKFMKTDTFGSLPAHRKLGILAIPFDYQDELQGYAMQLISEL